MTEKPKFVNTPPEVAEKEKEADKIAEKEAEIQPVIKEQFEEVVSPPKSIEWWIKRIVFWGLFTLVIVQNTIPVLRWFKYNFQSSTEIEFMKQHPDYAKITVELYGIAHGKADADLKEKMGVVKDTYK